MEELLQAKDWLLSDKPEELVGAWMIIAWPYNKNSSLGSVPINQL
jgi:hypothetical protein